VNVNKYEAHVLVLPEDRANSQIANGFLRDLALSVERIRVLPEAGGWREVLERFSTYVRTMEKYRLSLMVLLIDFDRRGDRLEQAMARVPDSLADRVFVLGAWTEPEDLKRAKLGSYEAIGLKLAKDCREGTDETWSHDLLRHNARELDRLRERVRLFLFR
jgi:hypothetical protein